MPTLRLRFPGGRYHATPFGNHVNEGQIEWPPSPWRLLRARIACGFTTQRWREIPPTAQKLVEKLAGTLPSYRLPAASAAHSRHFMPIGSLEKGREKTTLVFDTWANVGQETLVIHWDCSLADDETEQMRELAECLGYLGRSESGSRRNWARTKHCRRRFSMLSRIEMGSARAHVGSKFLSWRQFLPTNTALGSAKRRRRSCQIFHCQPRPRSHRPSC